MERAAAVLEELNAQALSERPMVYPRMDPESRVDFKAGDILSAIAVDDTEMRETTAAEGDDINTLFGQNDPERAFEMTPDSILSTVMHYVDNEGARRIVSKSILYLRANRDLFNKDTGQVIGRLRQMRPKLVDGRSGSSNPPVAQS